MRRVTATLAAFALAGALTVAGAGAAQAAPPGAAPAAAPSTAAAGMQLQGVYYDGAFCHSYGHSGAQNGSWGFWYCEFNPQAGTNGLWFLWASVG